MTSNKKRRGQVIGTFNVKSCISSTEPSRGKTKTDKNENDGNEKKVTDHNETFLKGNNGSSSPRADDHLPGNKQQECRNNLRAMEIPDAFHLPFHLDKDC